MRVLYLLLAVIITIFSLSSIGWSACEGDLNCDGDVDGEDLAIFAADYGTTDCGTCDDVIGRIEELEALVGPQVGDFVVGLELAGRLGELVHRLPPSPPDRGERGSARGKQIVHERSKDLIKM